MCPASDGAVHSAPSADDTALPAPRPATAADGLDGPAFEGSDVYGAIRWERREGPGDTVALYVGAPSPGLRVLVVRGEIDAAEADAVEQVATGLLDEAPLLVLDLAGLGFLASRGLAALVAVQRVAEAVGAELQVVTGANRAVLRPLQVTGVDTQLTLVAGWADRTTSP